MKASKWTLGLVAAGLVALAAAPAKAEPDPAAVAAAVNAAMKLKGPIEGVVKSMFTTHTIVPWHVEADGSGFVAMTLRDAGGTRLTDDISPAPFQNGPRWVRFEVVGLTSPESKKALRWHVKSDKKGKPDRNRQVDGGFNPGAGDRAQLTKRYDEEGYYLAARLQGMDKDTFLRLNPNAVVIVYLEK